MRRSGWAVIFLAAALMSGCGSGGGGSSDLLSPPDTDGGTGGSGGGGGATPANPPATPGTLGSLTDLGDLFAPGGDNWYFTSAAAMNDSGQVVGQSNRGAPVKAAFRWDPGTGAMTYLGIHLASYDDYYSLKSTASDKFFIYSEAVRINNAGIAIGNSTTGSGWPEETEKRGFVYNPNPQDDPSTLQDESLDPFIDLTPPPFIDSSGKRVIKAFSEAVGISAQGYVILTAEDSTGKHAYFWDGVSYRTVNDLRRDDNSLVAPFSVPDLLLLGVCRTFRPQDVKIAGL